MNEYRIVSASPLPQEGDEQPLRIPGPETVPGAAEALADGFVPLETITGVTWVAEAWPEEHRRVLVETRAAWMTDLDDGKLWLVRSPWPAIRPDQALSLVWAGRTRARPELWHTQASFILRLNETAALSRLQELQLRE